MSFHDLIHARVPIFLLFMSSLPTLGGIGTNGNRKEKENEEGGEGE